MNPDFLDPDFLYNYPNSLSFNLIFSRNLYKDYAYKDVIFFHYLNEMRRLFFLNIFTN